MHDPIQTRETVSLRPSDKGGKRAVGERIEDILKIVFIHAILIISLIIFYCVSHKGTESELQDTVPKIPNKYSQKFNCAALFPIPTFIYL